MAEKNHQTTRRRIPEDNNLRSHCHENHKFYN
jgi:hypothetical protein